MSETITMRNGGAKRCGARSTLLLALLMTTSVWLGVATPAIAGESEAPPTFDIISIEPYGSDPLRASAINDKGRVTGVIIHEVNGQNRAFPFVWSATERLRELPLPPGHTGASAADINNDGDVVGFVTYPDTGLVGYRWRTSLPSFAQLERFRALRNRLPLTISDDGRTIAGQGYSAQDPAWVFDLKTRSLTELRVGLEVVEGINQATDVNAHGLVVGTISTRLPNGNVRPNAFRFKHEAGGGGSMQLLPGPVHDWYWSDASGVNNDGDTVGFLFDFFDQSAAYWDGVTGAFTDLGIASPAELVTNAKAINDKGWIVGWSPNDHPLGLDTPFLWIDGTFYDLNDLAFHQFGGASALYRAHDVNNDGMILAEIVHFQPTLWFEDVVLVPEP